MLLKLLQRRCVARVYSSPSSQCQPTEVTTTTGSGRAALTRSTISSQQRTASAAFKANGSTPQFTESGSSCWVVGGGHGDLRPGSYQWRAWGPRQLTMTRIGEPGDLRRSNVAVSLTGSAKATAQLPQSPEPVCNWFQQRLEFDDVPNVNTIIDETLNIFKDRAREI